MNLFVRGAEDRDVDLARPTRPAPAVIGFWLAAGVLAAFAAGKAVQADTLDPDCFWHLAVADQLVRDGVGPIVDRLSFASRRDPWTPYSWAAELGMRAVWRAGGYRAAVATQAGVESAFVLLLAGACGQAVRWRDGLTAALLATAAGVYLSLPYLSFRPVTLALAGLAGCAWLTLGRRWEAAGQGAAQVTTAVPTVVLVGVVAVVANVHLYALLVPVAAGLWAVGEWLDGRPVRWTTGLAVSVAAVATPMLPGAVRTAMFYGTGDAMVAGRVIAEMRPWGRDWASMLMLLGLAAGAWRARGRVQTGTLLWSMVAAALTLRLGRFAPVLAIAACPPLAVGLASVTGDRVLGRRPVRAVLAAVLAACAVRLGIAFPRSDVSLSAWLNRLGPDVPGYPCAAVDFVAAHVPPVTGHLINEFDWGGYLAWRLGDRWQVLLDGRTQVYPPALWRATYLGTPDDCRAYLSGVPADAALLPAGRSRFRRSLLDSGWRLVHHDDRADVLVPGRGTATPPTETRPTFGRE